MAKSSSKLPAFLKKKAGAKDAKASADTKSPKKAAAKGGPAFGSPEWRKKHGLSVSKKK